MSAPEPSAWEATSGKESSSVGGEGTREAVTRSTSWVAVVASGGAADVGDGE